MQTIGKSLDTEISKEDQVNINNFSKTNQTFNEKKQQLAASKELLNQLEDCLTELDLNEEDFARLLNTKKYIFFSRVRFGECFFNIDNEQSKEYVEKKIKEVREEIVELQDSTYDLEKKMKKLKAVLYAKFGNQINLEED